MKKKKINNIFKQVTSLDPDEMSEVRDKLIPVFLELEKKDPYRDKKVIRFLKDRYVLALKEYKQGKLIDAEKYLRKKLG